MPGKTSRAKELEEQAGAPLWVVTYGDMMSLLLCFFVLLLSFANLDQVKYKQAAGSLKGAFGILRFNVEGQKMAIIPPLNPNLAELSQRLEARLQTIKHVMQRKSTGTLLKASNERTGVRFIVEGSLLFDKGSYELRPGAEEILSAFAEEVNKVSNDIRIDGHTDSTLYSPTSAGWPRDNMTLSLLRAYSVREALANRFGVAPERMSIQGFGANKPIEQGDSPEAMAKNRRVEIWVLATEQKEIASEFTRRTVRIPADWKITPLESWEIAPR